jgi:hypothetical protein
VAATKVEACIAWSLTAAASGYFPRVRHDNKELDTARAAKAGMPLGGHLAIVEYRADWLQLCQGFGLSTAVSRTPCFKCTAKREDIHKYDNAHLWHDKDHSDFTNDVSKLVFRTRLTAEEFEGVWSKSGLDMRKAGLRGRVLKQNVQVFDLHRNMPLELQKWDRIEVGGSVTDVHEHPDPGLPEYEVTFFRRNKEVPLLFVSPLFAVPGFKYEHLLADALHTIDLGAAAQLAGVAIVRLMKANVFGPSSTVVDRKSALSKITVGLWRYYRREQRQVRGGKLSTIRRLTLGMLNAKQHLKKPFLKAKGAASRWGGRAKLHTVNDVWWGGTFCVTHL